LSIALVILPSSTMALMSRRCLISMGLPYGSKFNLMTGLSRMKISNALDELFLVCHT